MHGGSYDGVSDPDLEMTWVLLILLPIILSGSSVLLSMLMLWFASTVSADGGVSCVSTFVLFWMLSVSYPSS